ncbi:MAG: hypothetical protein JOZ95_12925 [Solirubrobacterales bacterium]|nr:hypothetical protein [Solirubrobacterales bacterium]
MSSGLVPPHSSPRRAQLLEQLLVSLVATDPDTLPIKTRFLDDPTIALLDAWATVGDVVGFYLDRISAEGFLSTATEPGSILALAAMIGHRPRPGLAATVAIAVTMNTDPDDKAVQIDAGLLCQTVPGPGEQPQTFETTGGIVARPSWTLLKPKLDMPWTADAISAAAEVKIAGAASTLKPNDVMLIDVAQGADPVVVTVGSTTADYKANVTTVSLQQPNEGATTQTVATATAREAIAAAPEGVTTALDKLLASTALAKPTPAVPPSVDHLERNAGSIFVENSDAVPRLFSVLKPAVAAQLYSALDSTALGEAAVTGASALTVSAAPFGARAAPKPVFDDTGRPAGTEPWPLGGTQTLTLTMDGPAFAEALSQAMNPPGTEPPSPGLSDRILARFKGNAQLAARRELVVRVECQLAGPAGDVEESASGVIDVTPPYPPHPGPPPPTTWQPATLGELGSVTLGIDKQTSELTLKFTGGKDSRVTSLALTASLDRQTEAVAVAVGGTEIFTWEPLIATTVRGDSTPNHVSIGVVGVRTESRSVVVSIVTMLPVKDPNVLQLDRTYETIVAGTRAVIRSAPMAAPKAPDTASTKPLIAKINAVKTVAAAGFGITAKVTQLELDRPWIDNSAVDQFALRDVTVNAQPAPLDLLPQPLSDAGHPVTGDAIELEGLIAGMEAGRLIIVRGVRTDLPGGATVTSGELAMVASLTNGASGGETTHTTLQLSASLAYSYQRSTVQIFGNVVQARQGATLHEILGSGQPALAHQTFTLSSGPPIADPSTTASGFQSSLTVTVDGVGYQQVDRFDAATPSRSFMTGTDARGATTITFAAPLPAGSGNVRASYRAGDGRQGNVRTDQVTQLLTRPSGLASVTNPLPGEGGAPGDGPEDVRQATPSGLRGLGRIVTVQDCGDLAASWAGVGKALAESSPIDGQNGVLVTIAGVDPEPLPPDGGICLGIAAAIGSEADPQLPVRVVPADLYVIVVQASIVRDPLVDWDTTAQAVRAALLSTFGYENRGLGQDVALSDLIAAAHHAPSVLSATVTALALVPATVTATALTQRLPGLLAAPPPAVLTLAAAAAEWGVAATADQPAPEAVAYLSGAVPDTLILQEQTTP